MYQDHAFKFGEREGYLTISLDIAGPRTKEPDFEAIFDRLWDSIVTTTAEVIKMLPTMSTVHAADDVCNLPHTMTLTAEIGENQIDFVMELDDDETIPCGGLFIGVLPVFYSRLLHNLGHVISTDDPWELEDSPSTEQQVAGSLMVQSDTYEIADEAHRYLQQRPLI